MKVQKPYGDKVANAQISYGMQKDSSVSVIIELEKLV